MDDDAPKFDNLEDEVSYWKKKYQEVKEEFEEFQENSRELEAELEAQLEQADHRSRELQSCNHRLQIDCEILTDKLEKSQLEKHEQINELQEELSQIKSMKEELVKYIRELEQTNDDLERAKRVMVVSLEEFDARLNQAIERNAFLENELDEKEALSTTVQRLKDEARDLKYELQVRSRQSLILAEPDNDKICDKPPSPVDSNKLTSEIPTQTGLGSPLRVSHSTSVGTPLTPSARISALNIVGDLLRKVGALESKLASCRNYVKEPPTPRSHPGKISPHNSPRAKRVNRGDAASTVHGSLKVAT